MRLLKLKCSDKLLNYEYLTGQEGGLAPALFRLLLYLHTIRDAVAE